MTNPTNTTTTERTRQRDTGPKRQFIARIPRVHTHTPTTLANQRTPAQERASLRTTRTNIALAGLQLVIGYQWLVSGVDKLLLGDFQTQIGHLLATQISSGKLPALFAALLQSLVMPNASLFGFAIMAWIAVYSLGLI